MHLQSSENPQFNPHDLLQDYLSKNYDLLSEKLIRIIDYFDRFTYLALTNESRYFVNAFVKSFLYVFSQSDYVLSDRYVTRFIQFNLTISNLVAISDFQTTDAYLELLKLQPQNYAKLLILCSARNTFQIDRKVLFDASVDLANLWYSHYLEIYRTGLVNRNVYQNLREHILYDDERLTDFYIIEDLYLGVTYIDADADRILKSKINKSIKRSSLISNIVISSKPKSRKIAVISGFWFPQHSVHRKFSKYVEALKDSYELTLIHLGDRQIEVDTEFFHEVKYLQITNEEFDISSIHQNDFTAIYYPDIGISPESILLSNIRIAPIQICGLAYPVSTFGGEIDYFISGIDAELNRSPEANYSERLVLLNGLGVANTMSSYELQQGLSTRLISKEALDKKQFIINCPWDAPKVNYPLLVLLKRILQSANLSILFRFFTGDSLASKNDFIPFVKDIEKTLGAEHVCVYSDMAYTEYMKIMEEGDICLDSYHFGGFNVVVDGLHIQKPLVLLEGKRWYSLAGAKLMKKLGLGELVAKTPTEYTQLTLKLINNQDFYNAMLERVKKIDFNQIDFQLNDGKYFKKAIDFLLENHEHLQKDPTKKAIRIS